MNNKQTTFLKKFEQDMRTQKEDSMFIKSKYKNGENILNMHAVNVDEYVELVALGDTKGLWEECDKFLQDLSTP